MERIYSKSLFIFRRDLRLQDNIGLIAALKRSKIVIPCFIFDPKQIGNSNKYKSDFCLQFMLESLFDLEKQLQNKGAKLYLFHGTPVDIVEKLIQQETIDAVFLNRDYTPYSKKRDTSLQHLCKKYRLDFHQYDDVLINAPQEIIKQDGTPYLIFTPYYRKASSFPVSKPQQNNAKNYYYDPIKNTITLEKIINHSIYNDNIAVHGGRQECQKQLKKLGELKNYAVDRNFPAKEATSKLSAHLKFTTFSVREIYYQIYKQISHPSELLRELYWRDFFTMIAYYYPHVFGHAFHQKYDSLPWSYNSKYFSRWQNGETGFPIVDAGMRELNQTGYMHNRVRLITASFLIKDLHIDWRKGEKYFAQHLVDYDPAVNNGNWQWVAGTGCDAQPYFRSFNPWLQQRKFDPECIYIKRWIPELRHVDKRSIHNWEKITSHKHYSSYPGPMINHQLETQKTKKLYQSL